MLNVSLAFLVCWIVLFAGMRTSLRRILADAPNERSLHAVATPRFGGLGILAGLLATTFVTPAPAWWSDMTIAYVALSIISIADDRRPLPAGLRLIAHLIIAGGWLATLPSPWPTYTMLLFAIVWAINLNNFMDGADGLAAGMTIVGMASLAGAAAAASQPQLALACLTLAATATAFLCFNFPPASLFLGDAGSIPLGFAAAALAILGARAGAWHWIWPLILYFPFLFDATLTLTRRALRGERIWQAHREHLYQKAILGGLTHRQMTLRAYGLMLVCAVLALLSRNFPIWIQTLIIAVQTVVGMAIAYRIDSTFKQRTSPS